MAALANIQLTRSRTFCAFIVIVKSLVAMVNRCQLTGVLFHWILFEKGKVIIVVVFCKQLQ